MGVIGPDLTLSSIIRAISTNKESWLTFSKFAENVMRKKKDAERMRKALNHDPGSWRTGESIAVVGVEIL